jgi:branched-chain amino acid transport system permease protein
MVQYLLSLGPVVAIYVILAVSLNIVMGSTGVLTVAQAGFMGVGAYSTGLLTTDHHWPLIATLPVGWVIAGALGALLLLPALRIQGLLYAVVSFAFMVFATGVFTNANGLTHGALGVVGIPFFTVGPIHLTSNRDYCIAYCAIALVVVFIYYRLTASPLGVVLRAVRDDTDAAASVGVDTVRERLKVFVLGASLASLSGSLYAPLIHYVDPTTFTVFLSFLAITMVVFGGIGSVFGAVLGATLLTLLPDAITFIHLPSTTGGALAQIIYAGAVILVLRLRPRGIVPERNWRLRKRLAAMVAARQGAETVPQLEPGLAAGSDD